MHIATAQIIVYTSVVQTAGLVYTLLRITPLQYCGAERGGRQGGGGRSTPVWAFPPNFTVLYLHNYYIARYSSHFVTI